MKQILIFFYVVTISLAMNAQTNIVFAYDNAGNRVSRTIYLGAKSKKATTTKENVLNDMFNSNEVRIFPNPTKGLLKIEIANLSANDRCTLQLHSMTGQMIINQRAESVITTLDLSSFQTGYYILSIILNDQKSTWKIIKN